MITKAWSYAEITVDVANSIVSIDITIVLHPVKIATS